MVLPLQHLHDNGPLPVKKRPQVFYRQPAQLFQALFVAGVQVHDLSGQRVQRPALELQGTPHDDHQPVAFQEPSVDDVQIHLRSRLQELEEAHKARASSIRGDFEQALKTFFFIEPAGLKAAAERIARTTEDVSRAIPGSSWLLRVIWPWAADVEKEALYLWSRQEQRRLRKAAQRIRWFAVCHRPQAAYARSLRVLRDRRLHVPELVPDVEDLRRAHMAALTGLTVEQAKLEREAKSAIAAAVGRVAEFLSGEIRSINEWAQEQSALLQELVEQVRQEMRKLGLKPEASV